MSWEDLKVPMLVSSILLFIIALYSYLIRKWKYRARVGDYPFLHGLENKKVNGIIQIQFELPYRDQIQINILDGQELMIHNIANQLYEKGTHTLKFDTSGLDPGKYYYQLISTRQNNLKLFEKV